MKSAFYWGQILVLLFCLILTGDVFAKDEAPPTEEKTKIDEAKKEEEKSSDKENAEEDKDKEKKEEPSEEASKEEDKKEESLEEVPKDEQKEEDKDEEKEEALKEEALKEEKGEPSKEAPKEDEQKEEKSDVKDEKEKATKESSDKKEEEKDLLPEEKRGIQGNWYEKREWLLSAKNTNAKVQILADEIQKSREPVWTQYKEVDDLLDKFFTEIGGTKAQVKQLRNKYEKTADAAKSLERSLQEEQKKIKVPESRWYDKILDWTEGAVKWLKELVGIDTTEPPKEPPIDAENIFDDKSYEETLEIIKNDESALDEGVKSIEKLDDALHQRLDKLEAQIKEAINESEKASKLYNEIWEIIDHLKARENFFQIKAIGKKLKSVKEYVTGELKKDFESTIEKTKKQMEKVRNDAQKITGDLKITTEKIVSTATKVVEGVEAKKDSEKPVSSEGEVDIPVSVAESPKQEGETAPEKETVVPGAILPEVAVEDQSKSGGDMQSEVPATWYNRIGSAITVGATKTWGFLEKITGKVADFFSNTISVASEFIESKITKKKGQVLATASTELQPTAEGISPEKAIPVPELAKPEEQPEMGATDLSLPGDKKEEVSVEPVKPEEQKKDEVLAASVEPPKSEALETVGLVSAGSGPDESAKPEEQKKDKALAVSVEPPKPEGAPALEAPVATQPETKPEGAPVDESAKQEEPKKDEALAFSVEPPKAEEPVAAIAPTTREALPPAEGGG